ncbi:uncharacterized protein LOC116174475 [Photinus pyralis]|uniref:DUF4806 domain-containing protein n=1 Tax=Photinus pyralis TaxID=7054 RepID=A0A1Y1MHE3_PHOPY|nr:uncharacterized protein LOC116174475 [Photinus pyralis]
MTEAIKTLQLIGGKDLSDTCKRVLGKILSNEVAVAMNWSGRNQKEGFVHLNNIVNLVLVTVRKNPLCRDTNKQEVENSIKIWLRNASDRDGGRNKRMRRTE